mgnify:CR=1 FL=1
MSTKKVIGGSVAAIVILIIAQLAAQLAASALTLIKIPVSYTHLTLPTKLEV